MTPYYECFRLSFLKHVHFCFSTCTCGSPIATYSLYNPDLKSLYSWFTYCRCILCGEFLEVCSLRKLPLLLFSMEPNYSPIHGILYLGLEEIFACPIWIRLNKVLTILTPTMYYTKLVYNTFLSHDISFIVKKWLIYNFNGDL